MSIVRAQARAVAGPVQRIPGFFPPPEDRVQILSAYGPQHGFGHGFGAHLQAVAHVEHSASSKGGTDGQTRDDDASDSLVLRLEKRVRHGRYTIS